MPSVARGCTRLSTNDLLITAVAALLHPDIRDVKRIRAGLGGAFTLKRLRTTGDRTLVVSELEELRSAVPEFLKALTGR